MGSEVVINEFLRLLVLASQCLQCLCWVWLNLEPKWFLTCNVIIIEENNMLIEENDLFEEDKVILMLHRYEHFALVFLIHCVLISCMHFVLI
jgi:hypothetical protein